MDIVVEKVDIVLKKDGKDQIFFNDIDYTDRVRKFTLDFDAPKADRIQLELREDPGWEEFKKSFK